ncbi:FecR family protein [Winogradskyella vincentii]|uniref:FecR family protein n=1 Tax=Winogradskyella vincentii TaxID=2877122 RepID=A0ABS7Y3D7_9FLAO|nr:FecR family protein [Winogradskyella vincentii]MCA0154432.1 FecR family protein [Winogradskyella vincentii]
MDVEKDILRWFDGQLSIEELKALYPNNDFRNLEKTAFYSKQFDVPKIDEQSALNDFKKRSLEKESGKVIPLNFKAFLKIAAVFLVMLGSSYFLFFNNEKTFTTDVAQSTSLILPDNSEVILNAKSKLSYNKKKWEKSRNLQLNGEAFFKVMKGEKFTVNTETGSVEVLGTQFNVKERENYFEVQCYEGSVRVTDQSNTVILKPGESYRIINGKVNPVEKFNSKNPSWLNSESTFNNVPFWQVIEEFERQYDITITVDNINTEEVFTGGFTHSNKEVALQSITIPLKISYKIKGDNIEFYNYEAK